MIICCIIGWAWLVGIFTGWRTLFTGGCRSKKGPTSDVNKALRQKYDELGKMSFAECSVSFWLVVLVLLWVLREPLFIPGWDDWLKLKSGYSSDACAGILISFILFIFPNEKPDFIFFRRDKRKPPRIRRCLMSWTSMQNKFPWGVIILLGGGFALAEGVKRSGLSAWLGCALKERLGTMPHSVIALIFLALVTFITEIASNSATASIFTPVVLSVADSLNVNPLYFGLPTTLAASFAFMLPVATPPNAIVYESRMLKVTDMILAGFVMNLLCMGVTLINIHTWSYVLFGLGSHPSWADRNVTAFGNTTVC